MSAGDFNPIGIRLVLLPPTSANTQEVAQAIRRAAEQAAQGARAQVPPQTAAGGASGAVPPGSTAGIGGGFPPGGGGFGSYNSVAGPAGFAGGGNRQTMGQAGAHYALREYEFRQQYGREHQAAVEGMVERGEISPFMGDYLQDPRALRAAGRHIRAEQLRWQRGGPRREDVQARHEQSVDIERQRAETEQQRHEQFADMEEIRERRALAGQYRRAQRFVGRRDAATVAAEVRQHRDEGYVARSDIRAENIQERHEQYVASQRIQAESSQERNEQYAARQRISGQDAQQRHEQIADRQRLTGENVQERHEQYVARQRIQAENVQARHEQVADRQRIQSENVQQRHETTADRQRIRAEDSQNRDEGTAARQRTQIENQQARHEQQFDMANIRAENRQQRDVVGFEREGIRYARRLARADVNFRVQNAWTAGGRAGILEAEALGVGLDTPEGQQYMTRAVGERQRGFFGRPSARVLSMQMMFGAWELGRAAQGAAAVFSPTGTNVAQTMSQQMAGVHMMGSGIYGAMALGALDALDLLGNGNPYSSRGVARAQQAALLGIATTQAGIQSMAQGRTFEAEIRDTQAKTAMINFIGNPYAATRMAATTQANATVQAIYDEDMNLYQQFQDLRGVDDIEATKVRRQLMTFRKFAPQRRQAAWELKAVIEHKSYREQFTDIYASRLEIGGSSRDAEMMRLNATRMIGPLTPADQATYDVQRKQIEIKYDQRTAILSSNLQAARLVAEGKPYTAALKSVWDDFFIKTKNMVPGSADYMDLLTQARTQQTTLNTERGLSTTMLTLGIQGRTTELKKLLDRNPIGAQSSSLATKAIMDATQLITQEQPELAKDTLVNAKTEQRLLKQEYLDGFRAVQFDYQNMTIPQRDTESAEKVLESIKESVERLEEKVRPLYQ